jgi:hypothetical protein
MNNHRHPNYLLFAAEEKRKRKSMSYVFCNGTQPFFWTFTGWKAKLSAGEKPYPQYCN